MSNNPQIFHGDWWVPAVLDPDKRMVFQKPEQMMGHETKYTGTLTYYENEDSTLEIYHVPSNFHSSFYHRNEVMWGEDANGNIFTLFNVMIKDKKSLHDFTNTTFKVGLILIGEHVLSINEAWSKKCVVHFPYLNNWLFYETQHYIKFFCSEVSFQLQSEFNNRILFEVNTKEKACLRLYYNNSVKFDIEGYKVNREPYFAIEVSKPKSIEYYLKLIGEFEQFLSIALFSEQNVSSIKFLSKNGDQRGGCRLLVKQESSTNPAFSSLIKFVPLKEKMSSMLSLWHENFDKIAPISGYLINSLQRKHTFDVPDFLIIAQALDGYYKRFVNTKNIIGCRGYENGIKTLLEQFKDVKCVQKCKIDPKVLTHSRDKYSHLLLDKDKPLAVAGWDLYWLTEKCKILLTCCILYLLGLTNKEINLCCEHSPISQIIDSLPLEID